MIKKISIKSEASFDDIGQDFGDLKKINILYGPNGSGKTTISKVIGDQTKYPACSVTWVGEKKLQALVYNRDFVDRNFHPDKELKGIFTLGEHDASIIKSIENGKKELDDIVEKIKNNKITLHGVDGNGGKKSELAILKNEFSDQCWQLKQKYDNEFKAAFSGVRDKKEKFKTRLINESLNNSHSLLSLEKLKKKTQTIFADDLVKEELIPEILYSDLIDLEMSEILSKKVIGENDVDIAAMIKKLSNSDWVKQGHIYFERNDKYCPFCQQKTDSKFSKNLEEYFDETYLSDVAEIETLATNYDVFSEIIFALLEKILNGKPIYLDCLKLQAQKDIVEARITANKQHIARKQKEASTIVTLGTLKVILDEIKLEFIEANKKAREHNSTLDNLEKEKSTLTDQVWRFIVEEIKPIYNTYAKKKSDLDMAVTALESGIAEKEAKSKKKSKEIQDLEKQITSLQPTIDEINKLLISFGFSGFSLTQSEKDGFYILIRPGGEDAKETLSEGEKTFITFLYFYHLLKGSNSESGMTIDRVVVFDDPVSSLDSDILFIVSNLIKGIFEEVFSNTGFIKQVFVFTHNIYFHKEISFSKRRLGNTVFNYETFWTIKKTNISSVLKSHETNPIKTSYELLWCEIRDSNKSSLTIQNTMRRILENYFKIMGNVDNDEIINKFQGKEKQVCGSLFSWINDGSHFVNDDLYVSCDESTIEIYLDVFKKIFKETDHISHYDMMMGASSVNGEAAEAQKTIENLSETHHDE